MSGPEELTYQSYLRVPELLALQTPRSTPPHPEELHFIVVHQAMELWFRLLLADLDRSVAAVGGADMPLALRLARRHRDVVALLAAQMRSLEDMPPWSFHEFRSYLGQASGLQSLQFREIELLSGLREEGYLSGLRSMYPDGLPVDLATRLEQESLADAHQAAAARLGITEWADLFQHPERHPLFAVLTEALFDYDAEWARWRADHTLLVERALGARTRGTGGTAIGYLHRTERYRFFPYLWAARSELSVRGGGELVP